MAYTQDDLANIRSAIAKGAKRVRMNGEEVEFRDLAEMQKIEARIEADLSQTTRRGPIYPQTESGWR